MPYIYRDPHKQALLAMQQELQQLHQQRNAIDKRITELEVAVQTVIPLTQNPPEAPNATLPQLCLRVMSTQSGSLWSIPDIRDGLRLMGVEVPGSNPLAILHTALGRLAQNRFVQAAPRTPGGPLAYKIKMAGILQVQQQGFS